MAIISQRTTGLAGGPETSRPGRGSWGHSWIMRCCLEGSVFRQAHQAIALVTFSLAFLLSHPFAVVVNHQDVFRVPDVLQRVTVQHREVCPPTRGEGAAVSCMK